MGSRDSRLAVVQSELVMAELARARPDATFELVAMKTSGDRILDKPLESVGGKGLFVKELDQALREGRVDMCVHSYKDLPVPTPDDLPVLAVTRREDPRDVLILPPGRTEPDFSLPLGTSSLRRRLQAALLFPRWECIPVRGNIHTRLAKLDRGEYGGLILAAAGINRMGLADRVSRIFSPEEILPASCQGFLAVQGRADGEFAWLAEAEDRDARDASTAERAFVSGLGATCASPVAAFAEIDGEQLVLRGWYVDETGAVSRDWVSGARGDAAELGRDLAAKLKGRR